MPSLSDLWDENKYSEGDPIRQLISATKAAKEWPIDALAWGADLVDLGSSGLSRALRNQDLKTDLGGNLRRSVTPPLYEGKPSFSATRAEDLEDARSIGRMLNPLLLGGNQKLPGSEIVDKIVNKLIGVSKSFSEARRQFVIGKKEGLAEEVQPEVKEVVDSLMGMKMDRRQFNKTAAASAAGAAVGGGLLSKFIPKAKVADKLPEATQVAKVADKIESSPYKYNTLKEYLDNVDEYVTTNIDNLSGYGDTKEQIMKEILLCDEYLYTSMKAGQRAGFDKQHTKDVLNEFSPQAKKEMKEFKSLTKQIDTDYANPHDWTEWAIRDSEDPTKIIEELKKWYRP